MDGLVWFDSDSSSTFTVQLGSVTVSFGGAVDCKRFKYIHQVQWLYWSGHACPVLCETKRSDCCHAGAQSIVRQRDDKLSRLLRGFDSETGRFFHLSAISDWSNRLTVYSCAIGRRSRTLKAGGVLRVQGLYWEQYMAVSGSVNSWTPNSDVQLRMSQIWCREQTLRTSSIRRAH